MSISINDNLKVESNKALDNRYGPWASVSAAQTGVPSYQRYQGLTVGVLTSGVVADYWWMDGIANEQLVLKQNGATIGNGQPVTGGYY